MSSGNINRIKKQFRLSEKAWFVKRARQQNLDLLVSLQNYDELYLAKYMKRTLQLTDNFEVLKQLEISENLIQNAICNRNQKCKVKMMTKILPEVSPAINFEFMQAKISYHTRKYLLAHTLKTYINILLLFKVLKNHRIIALSKLTKKNYKIRH